ncbi:uncharacterized protein LOC116193136 [Punica granatum]|uniref:Uncharacterized protein n=2 Tax=Punica granatum TaxID=22663 RepID=A0A218XN77_PUNGR|nr:uncharacterized protein LOC116193136 [Punica granatum]OWM86364.1 hypothetical protein CDL15_Pgr021450 [Punica granatum]PKI51304.1 hypothetical protein CRG98_028308 [Punica granatum]
MAAASPAQGNTGATTTAGFAAAHTPPKTLRGLNKPKCIQCGNVARSRCPYQSCKSCCSRAQNPCHIHVLKANATFPDKTPASSPPLFNQHSTEPSSAGSSLRVASLRQLSSNFAQFNNVHMPVRSRKPLTKKDVAAINEWRFSKLKEFQDRNIELENESFDRYLQNVGLLKEVFSVESVAEHSVRDSSETDSNPAPSENSERMILEMKLKLRSNETRKENFRKRIQHIVDRGLKKLKKREVGDDFSDSADQNGLIKRPKLKTLHVEKTSTIVELNEKLSKARTEEDLKSCLELKAQLLNPQKGSTETASESTEKSHGQVEEDDGVVGQASAYFQPKLVSPVEIDQQTVNCIDAQFSSLDQIEGV